MIPKNYKDWCNLNKQGMKEYGDIFPNRIVPIISMIPIKFEHPKLDAPERAYMVRGTNLTEKQLRLLVNKISESFKDSNKTEIRRYILDNNLPVRERLTSGSGTRRIHMYLP